jgi:hypothetical protein
MDTSGKQTKNKHLLMQYRLFRCSGGDIARRHSGTNRHEQENFMNFLNLIIDRPRHFGKERNCAIDLELDNLPATVTDLMTRYIPDLIYLNQLSYDRADFIMRDLLRLLSGYDVKATVTDHTQRETLVCRFI